MAEPTERLPQQAVGVGDDEGESAQVALEQFVFDNPDLERLEAILDNFNPFVALRWTRQEARHSAFLRWLLDPAETHGLGPYFLGRFLKRLVRRRPPEKLSVIQVDSWDLSRTVVRQEWNAIDLLIEDDRNGFVAVIENKIDSPEHSQQLKRYREIIEQHYPQHVKLFAYLTPDGEAPSDETYTSVAYTEVIELLEDTLARRGEQLADEVRGFLGQYVEMVRRFIMADSEIQQLCRTIYEKHRKALDAIFEFRRDRVLEVSAILRELVQAQPQLLADHSTKSYVRFVPVSLDFLPKGEPEWTPTGRLLLFEIQNFQFGVRLTLMLGPGEKDLRDRLYQQVRKHPKVFNRTTQTLSPKFWTCHSEKWVTGKQYEELDLEALRQELQQRLHHFVHDHLPAIEEVLLPLRQERRSV